MGRWIGKHALNLENSWGETTSLLTPMNSDEYSNLDVTERKHWYYAGKREMVRRWLARSTRLGHEQTLLDCGAGTGLFAQEMSAHCRVLVLDDHEESLRRLRERFPADQVLRVSAEGIPLGSGSVDAVTALDTLEHIERDQLAVDEFARVLRPGGVAVVTVPASMALWSDWDVSLHHYRRYNRDQLRALFPREDWELLYVNYTNVVVYPAVWCVRKWRAWRRQVSGRRTEDQIPPRWLNRLLRATFVRMAGWRMPFPFGVSLLLVARRRE
jgi:ubiquinone/menaquinone biosynthesis C-methylase UbiE